MRKRPSFFGQLFSGSLQRPKLIFSMTSARKDSEFFGQLFSRSLQNRSRSYFFGELVSDDLFILSTKNIIVGQ